MTPINEHIKNGIIGKHFKQNVANHKRPAQFHCQFFGPTEERSWVSAKAIIPWDDDIEPKEQFTYISNSLKSKLKGKLQKRIVTQVNTIKLYQNKIKSKVCHCP